MRWNSFRFLILIILTFSKIIHAQVYLVDADGNSLPIPAELQEQLNLGNLENEIISWYAKQGFLNVDVEKYIDNKFRVIKGCKFDAIIFGLDKEIHTMKYSESNIAAYFKERIEQEVREGKYYTSIKVESINPMVKRCLVEIYAGFNTNEQVFLRDLTFDGNTLNSDSYITKRSYFKDSLLASTENITELGLKISQTELFEFVGDPEVIIQEEVPMLKMKVVEQSRNQFDGVLGYVPNIKGNGQIVGDLSLSLWGVFADGNGVDVDYERLEPEVSRLTLNISQHWFGLIPIGSSFGFNIFQNDTTYQSREIYLDGYLELGNGLKLIGDIGFSTITGSSNSELWSEPDGKKRKGSLGFRYSNVFGTEAPRDAIETEIRFGVVNRIIEIYSLPSFNQQFIEVLFKKYTPIGKQSVIAGQLQSYVLKSKNFTDIDLYRFGGAKSLRGFMEEQFLASQVAWGDLEYRYLTNASSYLFGFVGAGWFHRPKLITESNAQFKTTKCIQSLGFGLSYKTKVGRLTFTYALSPNESLGNGKVHVGFITSL